MANNIDVTPGTGKTVATTEVGGFQYQNVIIADTSGTAVNFGAPVPLIGADGVTLMSNANPIPISDAGGSLTVDGAVTVSGAVASGAADSGNPVKAGGKYVAAGLSLLAGGERVDMQMSDRGYLKVVLANPSSPTGLVNASSPTDATSLGNAFLLTQGVPILYNGSSGDRGRSVVAAANTQGTGTQAIGLPLWSTTDLSVVAVSTAASGDTTLVSATASQTTRCYRLRLTAAGTVTAKITDGAAGTVLERFEMIAGQSVLLPLSDRPYHKGTANTAMILNLSAAIQVSGVYEYVKSA